MRRRHVVLTQDAEDDLDAIADWLVDQAAPEVAIRYVQLIRDRIATLTHAAERGSLRTDGDRVYRLVGLLRSVNVAFVVRNETVVVFRVLYGGQILKPDQPIKEHDD